MFFVFCPAVVSGCLIYATAASLPSWKLLREEISFSLQWDIGFIRLGGNKTTQCDFYKIYISIIWPNIIYSHRYLFPPYIFIYIYNELSHRTAGNTYRGDFFNSSKGLYRTSYTDELITEVFCTCENRTYYSMIQSLIVSLSPNIFIIY